MTLNPPDSGCVVTCWLGGRLGQLAGGLLVQGERPTQDRLVLHLPPPPGRGHPHGVSLGAGLRVTFNRKWLLEMLTINSLSI